MKKSFNGAWKTQLKLVVVVDGGMDTFWNLRKCKFFFLKVYNCASYKSLVNYLVLLCTKESENIWAHQKTPSVVKMFNRYNFYMYLHGKKVDKAEENIIRVELNKFHLNKTFIYWKIVSWRMNFLSIFQKKKK